MSSLATPLRLGQVALRNRVVFSAHLTNFAADGLVSDQHVAYYAARAAGGAGLVITEEHTVHPSDRPYEKMIRGYDPAVLPGYRALTGAVHAAGAVVFAQLNHNGGQSSGLYTRQPVLAPSPVPDALFREVPVALSRSRIAALVAGYAETAARCVEGGFDGVELQGSHSSLIRQFLSRATNRRTDAYGVSRARFLLEVIAAVRAAIGDAVLGVRLGGDEMIESGVTLDEGVETARAVAATGQVDYLNTSIGLATETLFLIQAGMRIPPRYALHIPAAMRAATGLPVIGVGRFKSRAQAEQALDAGHADLIGVVRGQIADPEFATKAPDEVQTCLSCNQECVGRVGFNRWIGCLVNPRAGSEASPVPVGPVPVGPVPVSPVLVGPVLVGPVTAGPVTAGPVAASSLPTPRRRSLRVRVVGGGPGGLRAAVTAAERGHTVTLDERSGVLGGAVPLAARAPSRAEFAELTRSLAAAATRAGVTIRTGVNVSAADLLAEAPDVVVLATGARPVRPSWATSSRVVDVRQVLSGRVEPFGTVLVHDELGFHEGTSVAELLADRGCAVEITTPGMIVGQDLGTTLDLELWTIAAEARGVVCTPDVSVASVEDVPVPAVGGTVRPAVDGTIRPAVGRAGRPALTGAGRVRVVLGHHPTGARLVRIVDWIVASVHPAPEDALWHALRGAPFPVHRVGDCLAPRRAHAAVLEGDRVAAAL